MTGFAATSDAMIDPKPYAPACERNAQPIFAQLDKALPGPQTILEIGSGTGQHAVHFAARRSDWSWQCSDRPENLPGIGQWLDEAALPNTPAALALDVAQQDWPAQAYSAVFSANSLHIMAWPQVEQLFAGLPGLMLPGGKLLIYGPFLYQDRPTAASNLAFDTQLRSRRSSQGIREFDAVDALARQAGLALLADHEMPANNRLLIWQRRQEDTD